MFVRLCVCVLFHVFARDKEKERRKLHLKKCVSIVSRRACIRDQLSRAPIFALIIKTDAITQNPGVRPNVTTRNPHRAVVPETDAVQRREGRCAWGLFPHMNINTVQPLRA